MLADSPTYPEVETVERSEDFTVKYARGMSARQPGCRGQSFPLESRFCKAKPDPQPAPSVLQEFIIHCSFAVNTF